MVEYHGINAGRVTVSAIFPRFFRELVIARVKIGNFWRKIDNPDYTSQEGSYCRHALAGRQLPELRHTRGLLLAAFVNAFTVPTHIAHLGPAGC